MFKGGGGGCLRVVYAGASKSGGFSGSAPLAGCLVRYQQVINKVNSMGKYNFPRYQQGTNKVPTRFQQGTNKVPARYQQGANKVPTRYQQGTNRVPTRPSRIMVRKKKQGQPRFHNLVDREFRPPER